MVRYGDKGKWYGKKGYGVGDIWGAWRWTARLDRVARKASVKDEISKEGRVWTKRISERRASML